jgi:hypothetical protein
MGFSLEDLCQLDVSKGRLYDDVEDKFWRFSSRFIKIHQDVSYIYIYIYIRLPMALIIYSIDTVMRALTN